MIGGQATSRRGLAVHVHAAVALGQGVRLALEDLARRVLAAEGFRSGGLSIAVVGAQRMARLHERYMNEPTPTDVLTFDLGGDHAAGQIEAEIVVCAAVARDAALQRLAAAQASSKRRGATSETLSSGGAAGPARELLRELALYVTHGVLHLSGFSDHRAADAERMHAREDELLSLLGLGRVFVEGEAARSSAARTTEVRNLERRKRGGAK